MLSTLLSRGDGRHVRGTRDLETSSTVIRKGNFEINWNAHRAGPYKLQRTRTLTDPESWEDIVITRDKGTKVSIERTAACGVCRAALFCTLLPGGKSFVAQDGVLLKD